MYTPGRRTLLGIMTLAALAGSALAQERIVIERSPGRAAAPTKIPISALPTVISAPGSYYVTKDLTGGAGDGISVLSEDVTIDLCGFTLRGGVNSTRGIFAWPSAKNLCIYGGVIRDWGAGGIAASGVNNVLLHDLKVTGNGGTGVDVRDNCTIRDVIAAENLGHGISARSNNQLAGCIAWLNGQTGISCGDGNTLRDCMARSNAGRGFVALDGAFSTCSATGNQDGFSVGWGSTLSGCAATRNRGAGFAFEGPDGGVTFAHCSARGNVLSGFVTGPAAMLTGCSATANVQNGFDCGDGTTVSDCSAVRNSGHGFALGSGTSIHGSTARQNAGHGIDADTCCRIVGNTSCDNGFVPIQAQPLPGSGAAGIFAGGYGSVIEANLVTDNDRGVDVDGQRNCVVKNRASQNGVDFAIVPGNTVGEIQNHINIGSVNTPNELANVRY